MQQDIYSSEGELIGKLDIVTPAPRIISFDYPGGNDEYPTVLVFKEEEGFIEGINLNYFTSLSCSSIRTNLFSNYRRYTISKMYNIKELVDR